MKRFLYLTVLIPLLFIGCETRIIDITGTLSGTVVEMTTGDVIAGALVTLAPSGKNTYTGVDGFFEFQELDAQQYTLTVQATGYQTNRKTVSIVAGSTERVNITLQKAE